jgi:hypothetical protein
VRFLDQLSPHLVIDSSRRRDADPGPRPEGVRISPLGHAAPALWAFPGLPIRERRDGSRARRAHALSACRPPWLGYPGEAVTLPTQPCPGCRGQRPATGRFPSGAISPASGRRGPIWEWSGQGAGARGGAACAAAWRPVDPAPRSESGTNGQVVAARISGSGSRSCRQAGEGRECAGPLRRSRHR